MSETWKDLTSSKLSLKLLKYLFPVFVLELQHFITLLLFSLLVSLTF